MNRLILTDSMVVTATVAMLVNGCGLTTMEAFDLYKQYVKDHDRKVAEKAYRKGYADGLYRNEDYKYPSF